MSCIQYTLMFIWPKVSNNVRAHIPALNHEFGYNVKICQLLNIKKSLVYKTLQLHHSYDVTVPLKTEY